MSDVVNPETDETIIEAGTLISEDLCDLIDQLGVDEVKVRTPLTCDTRYGLCAKCYGRDLGRGTLVNVGEAVGVIAAQSIGEPGTQLTMRTFHVGGAASRAAVASQVETKSAGVVRFTSTMRYVTSAKGEKIVITRSGEVLITDENGREREKHKVPYGSTLQVADGQQVKAGTKLAVWDPHTRPIIAEYSGLVKFENVEEGVTVAKQIDEVTGLSTLVVIDPKRGGKGQTKGLRPQVKLFDADGEEVRMHGSESCRDDYLPGRPLLLLCSTGSRSRWVTCLPASRRNRRKRAISPGACRGSLNCSKPERRKTRVCSRNSPGPCRSGKIPRASSAWWITDLDGATHEYLIPKDKHVLVHDGQVVNKGELIVDGAPDPHDILRLQGVEALAIYITDEVQDVYRLQGVKINDKHIEVIVRQMLRRALVVDPGDTKFIRGEQVERAHLLDENDRMHAVGKLTASYEPVLLGITKASLSTDSFISCGVLPGNDPCAYRGRYYGQAG